MSDKAARPRHAQARSLEQAASTIFVLTALLPLLIFVYILFTLDVLQNPRVQLGLGLSLAISVLGFSVLRTVMRRTSEVLQLLVRAEPQAVSPAPRPTAPAEHEPQRQPAASARVKGAASSTAAADSAPAIGSIRELRDAADAVARRWKREAEPLIGRPVRVSVAHLEQPEVGTIARVTADGLVLEQDGQEFGVLWRLVSSIEADPGEP